MITLLYTQLYRLKVVKLCIAGRKSKMVLRRCTPLLAESLKIFSHCIKDNHFNVHIVIEVQLLATVYNCGS